MRASEIKRTTKETDVFVSLNLEGGPLEIDTGIGFFDHMLHALLFYAGFGGTVTALAVNIEQAPTHIAGLPVSVNVGCHVTRHASTVL